jgi:phosphate transport system substrate-binding protein
MEFIDLLHSESNNGKQMKNCKTWRSFLALLSSIILFSCSGEKRETLTSGSIAMMTSEDVYPVINIQVGDFQRMYEEVKIKNFSVSTREAIVHMLSDSIKLIVCGGEFSDEEKTAIIKNGFEVDSTKIAYDGIAVIVNEKNPLTQLTTIELKDLLSGVKDRWSKVNGSTLSSAVVVAIGDPNSGTFKYMKTWMGNNAKFSANVLPCSTSSEVMSVVSDRPNAIGFVGISWLAAMPKNIRVLELGDPQFRRDSTATAMEFFTPHQANIYRRYYPLSRTVYIYSHNVGKGVGMGFTSFAASSDGQKIIVSNGLVPATMPVRLVQLKTP